MSHESGTDPAVGVIIPTTDSGVRSNSIEATTNSSDPGAFEQIAGSTTQSPIRGNQVGDSEFLQVRFCCGDR